MKTLKTTIVFLLFLFVYQNTEAQFLKKLGKKVEEAAERAIIKKAEQKVTKETEKAMDSILNPKTGKMEKRKKGKNQNTNNEINTTENEDEYENNEEVILPATYNFEWEYTLKMESKEIKKQKKDMGDMKITYLLNPNSTAFGSRFEMGPKNKMMSNMITIMDFDSGTNLMLIEMDGQKIIQKMPSIFNQDIDESLKEHESKEYTVVKTDTKVILGYSCQGFKITSNKGIVNAYIAKNAPVSFQNNFSGNSKFKPKGFDPKWLDGIENGLMMEMDFKSSEKEKYNMKMTCVSLKKNPITINLSDYKSFMD